MAITGVGSINYYAYNAGTNKLHLKDGTDNDFTSWFNEEKKEGELSDEISGFDYSNKAVLKAAMEWWFKPEYYKFVWGEDWRPQASGEDAEGNKIYNIEISNVESWKTVAKCEGNGEFVSLAATWLKPGETMEAGRPYYNSDTWFEEDCKEELGDTFQMPKSGQELSSAIDQNPKFAKLYYNALSKYNKWWDMYEGWLNSSVNQWEEDDLKRLDTRDRLQPKKGENKTLN